MRYLIVVFLIATAAAQSESYKVLVSSKAPVGLFNDICNISLEGSDGKSYIIQRNTAYEACHLYDVGEIFFGKQEGMKLLMFWQDRKGKTKKQTWNIRTVAK